VLALWAPATLFSEILPVRQVILAALVRSSKLGILVALAYFAHHERVRFAGPTREVVVAILALAAFLALKMNARLWVVAVLGAAHFLPASVAPRRGPRAALAVNATIAVLAAALIAAVGLKVKERMADGLAWSGGVSPAWKDVQL